ncbi:MAG: Kelch repeat-containing protein, partial [Dehalococcoidia bacterium]
HPIVSPTLWAESGMAYDAATSNVVLFGGCCTATGGRFSDTWIWNGSAWAQQSPATSPPARDSADLAYDAARGVVILFGGAGGCASGGCAYLNDTWAWNGSTWAPQFPSTSPPTRVGSSMVNDAATNTVVLFGGQTCNNSGCRLLSDTWTWNGTTWTLQEPAGSPSPRAGAGLAYDAAHGLVVLFGGCCSNGYTNDTLVWDGSTWHFPGPVLQPAITSISPAAGPTTGGLVVVISGTNLETFGYTTTVSFGEVAATFAYCYGPSCEVTSPPGSGAVDVRVSVGGQTSLVVAADRFAYITPATPNWVQQQPSLSPPTRAFTDMAYDVAARTTVLFGGFACTNYPCTPVGDTWTWDGNTWTQQSPPVSPSPRGGARLAYDAATGTVLLFGGDNNCVGGACSLFNETWTWNGSAWTQQHPTSSPPARSYAGMTYDAAHGVVVLFGGVKDCSNTGCTYLNDTWTWDGTTWRQQNPVASPSGRDGMGMAFDADRNNVVLFGGLSCPQSSGCTYFSDTWIWTGNTWSQQHPASSPSIRFGTAMAYDGGRKTMLLFGGDVCPDITSSTYACWYGNDTWEWNGSTWNQRFPANAAGPRDNSGMAYDSARDQVVLFGGCCGSTGSLNDTWTIGNGMPPPPPPPAAAPIPCPTGITFRIKPLDVLPIAANGYGFASLVMTVPSGLSAASFDVKVISLNPQVLQIVSCTPVLGACDTSGLPGQFEAAGSIPPPGTGTFSLARISVRLVGGASAARGQLAGAAGLSANLGFASAAATDGSGGTIQSTNQGSSVKQVALGDVNGDGVMNAVDALCVLRTVAGMPGTQACPAVPLQVPSPANVNPDNQVNAVDAPCILRNVASLTGTTVCPQIPPLPANGAVGAALPRAIAQP